jgi:hypothetical protein
MVTRFRIWVVVLLALIAADAIIGPGHAPILTFTVIVAFLSTVTLAIIRGMRGAVERAKEEASK